MGKILSTSFMGAAMISVYSYFFNKKELSDSIATFIITFVILLVVLYLKYKYIAKNKRGN